MIGTPKAIFLSYASQDAAAARGVGEALRGAGLEVWFDQSELRGGDAWDEMIRRQIADCALFIPIISASTAARLEGYFRLEWTLADQRTHRMARNKPFIVPVCIDDTPESAADVPESFVRVHWSRLAGGVTPAAFAQRIAGLLGAGGNAQPAPAQLSSTPLPTPALLPTAPPGATRRRVAAGAVLAAAVVAAVAWIGLRHAPIVSQPVAEPAPTAAPSIPEKSIAVLPFVDMSEKKDQEFFSDGLSEELLDLLAQVPDLRVAARTSSFYFKGKPEDVATIGQKLRVAHVLEGSVRKAGNKIRVTVQLIRADNGYHLWSKTYDRNVSDIFAVQDEISNAVVDALKLQLLSGPLISRHQTSNVDAYSQYLIGNQLRNRDDPQSNDQARDAYKKALELDPHYAAAYSGLADAEWRIADQTTNDPAGYARSLAAAEKAIALAPDAPEGYWARGQLLCFYYFDWKGSEVDLEKATSLDPTFDPARMALADLHATLGELPGAVEEMQQILARDPLAGRTLRRLGRLQLNLRRYSDARETVARIDKIGSNAYPSFKFQLAGDLELLQGRPAAALEFYRRDPSPVLRQLGISMAEHDLGHADESQHALDEIIRQAGDAFSYQYAEASAWRGDKEAAFHWLDRAWLVHDGGLTYLKSDRFVDNVRGDPRFAALLVKMHLPPDGPEIKPKLPATN